MREALLFVKKDTFLKNIIKKVFMSYFHQVDKMLQELERTIMQMV